MDPQLKAITTIDRNIAVNAGAGTGKTKVLTERFINILENGSLEKDREVESIVAITFTKKATEEMIDRIRALIKDNFSKGEVWRKYYRDMEKANISTIHSFCAKILRENPIEAKVDPMFEVIEDYTAKELLKKSVDEVLNIYLRKSSIFPKIVLEFNQNRLSNLYDDFIKVYNSIRTIGLSFDEVKKITMQNLDNLSINREDIAFIKDTMLYLMGKARKNSKLYNFQENEVWHNFKNDNYPDDELFSYLETIKDNIGNNKKEAETIDKLNATINEVLMAKDLAYKEFYETILDILIQIDISYTNLKKKMGGLDYDDLQIKVLYLLDDEKILRKYQEKYKYIMIDEFQDTNELQKKIFYKLSTIKKPLDRNNFFVVGDPKQSIYAFRGADIDVFYQVLNDIRKESEENIITLEKNYRSVNTLINFVNRIFRELMGDKYQGLEAVNKSQNKIDVEVLVNEDESDIEYEAELIAKRIRQMVDKKEYDYKDVALLFRSTTRNFYYEEALKKYNIPYYNSSSKRYFYRSEILDIINALKAISNPYDSIAMIGFLRGPMIGLSDKTIFCLLTLEERNIYHSIEEALEMDLGEKEVSKLKNAYQLLNYFYSIKDISTIPYVVNQLMEKTNFIEIQLLKGDGKQSISNIYKFINLADEFDNMSNKSLEAFIDYIEKIRSEDTAEASISSENAVNLLTIHKSKGLQFPVVIIPELSKDINNRHPKFLFNKDIGLGIQFKESQGIYDKIKSIQNDKLNEEKKRIFYVAMTRAKNKLILGSIGQNKGYKKMIKDYLDLEDCHIVDSIDLDSRKEVKVLELLDATSDESIELDSYPILTDENIYSHNKFKRFSISQFLMFKNCKRRFYYTYIDKLEIPNLDKKDTTMLSGIDRGNIIHKFSQLYDGSSDADVQLLNDITLGYGLKFNEDVYLELKPYVENYKTYAKKKFKQVYIEKPFSIKIDNYYMTGVIDRINISDTASEIVDLKTNKLYNKDLLIEQYTPQLRFYSYVAGKVFNNKIDRATLLFLENGEEIDIDISKEKVDETMSQLRDFFDFLEKNSDMESYVMINNCQTCEFENFCKILNFHSK